MSTITDPIALARCAAADFKACYGDDLLSVIVYGSAAGGHFDPKRSDINVLVVLSAMTLPLVERSQALQEKWMKKRFSRPLFMDREYIDSSIDSFPIEFLAMKESYAVVIGEDVLKGLKVDGRDLRIQVERELKGKWLHLLREWPGAKRNRHLLRNVLHGSMRDFSAIFQALLHLKNEPVLPERRSLFARVTQSYGLGDNSLLKTMEAVKNGSKKEMVDIFPAYMQAIKTLITQVDQLSTEERA
jgi:predicted nucleotidyltransferase